MAAPAPLCQDLSLLGEVAGKVSKGLRQESIAALPSTTYALHTAAAAGGVDSSSGPDKCVAT